MEKENYSLQDYLAEGRLLITDNPVMMIHYTYVLGGNKIMECMLLQENDEDLKPFLQALEKVEENGTNDEKAALWFADRIGAQKRALMRGKKYLEAGCSNNVDEKDAIQALDEHSKMTTEVKTVEKDGVE